MNKPDEENITYVMVEQPNVNLMQNSKKIKLMNLPEQENITYVAVEPAKVGVAQGTSKSQLAIGEIGGSGNLDKVRDLLFGTQVRDFEKRFNRLEERLVKECANLRDDTLKCLDSIETYVQKEFESLTEGLKTEQTERDGAVQELAQNFKDTTKSLENETKKRLESVQTYSQTEVLSLNDRLKNEQSERGEALKELVQNIKDVTKSLEKKITQLDEQTTQKQRELRQQILDQSKSLDDDLRQKHESILSFVEQEVQEISNDKTDRSTLAALFTQLALQLNNDFEISGNE